MKFREFIIKRFFETKPTDLEVIKPLTPQPVRHPFFPFDLNEFKPMTSEALAYIASMPSYENLSREVYFLPQEPGAYKLPLKLSKAQWSYLHRALEGFFVHNRKIPRHLFKRLPGIQSVFFSFGYRMY